MKTKRVIAKLIMFLCLAIILDQTLGAFLGILDARLSPNDFARLRMAEFYEYGSNIDVALMGSSHAYRSFDPAIFDEALHVNSFNLGSNGQNPTTTYYVLKEVLRNGHRPRLMIMETYWLALSGSKTNYNSASYVFHNMEFSANKLSMFLSAFEFPSSLKLLSKTHEHRRIVMPCIALLIRKAAGWLLRRQFGAESSSDRYTGRGYVENPSVATEVELAKNNFVNRSLNLNQYKLYYLEKTIDLAKRQGIQVVLVSTPVSPTAFKDVLDYQEAYSIIKGIADKNGVEYIDYNILNSELGMFSDENFKDDDHLNKSGVKILDEHLIQWLDRDDESSPSHVDH